MSNVCRVFLHYLYNCWKKSVFAPVYLCAVMLLGVLKVIFGTCSSEAAPALTLAVQMNFTVTDRTQTTAVYSKSHH